VRSLTHVTMISLERKGSWHCQYSRSGSGWILGLAFWLNGILSKIDRFRDLPRHPICAVCQIGILLVPSHLALSFRMLQSLLECTKFRLSRKVSGFSLERQLVDGCCK
jgi:hypothetical protein